MSVFGFFGWKNKGNWGKVNTPGGDKAVQQVIERYETLTKIESGATPDPRIETVNRIAKGLNVGVDDLLKQ